MEDRFAELRAADPHGRRSNNEIERQLEGESIVEDIEAAQNFDDLKDAVLRLARWTGAS